MFSAYLTHVSKASSSLTLTLLAWVDRLPLGSREGGCNALWHPWKGSAARDRISLAYVLPRLTPCRRRRLCRCDSLCSSSRLQRRQEAIRNHRSKQTAIKVRDGWGNTRWWDGYRGYKQAFTNFCMELNVRSLTLWSSWAKPLYRAWSISMSPWKQWWRGHFDLAPIMSMLFRKHAHRESTKHTTTQG